MSLSLGVQIGEYTERLSKNNTLPKVTIPLENLYEKDEGSQYQEVTLEKGNTISNQIMEPTIHICQSIKRTDVLNHFTTPWLLLK